ncbi:MAG: WYL domain-containing transcriptional regulator [Deinococcaceae bacterium]
MCLLQIGRFLVKKSIRLGRVIQILKARPRTVLALSEELGVGVRTLQRDLEDLRCSGVDIQKNQNMYFIPIGASNLTDTDALAIHAAARLLYHHAFVGNRAYANALDKLAALLPPNIRTLLHESTPRFDGSVQNNQREFEHVARAWIEQRLLQFEYRSPRGEISLRTLEVYFIEVSRVNLDIYILGRDIKKDQIRIFKLSRMSKTLMLSQSYNIPDHFSVSQILNHAWGVVGMTGGGVIRVKLRFSRDAAYRIKEGGYPTLKIDVEREDGALDVSLEVGTTSDGFPLELLSWIQSWGCRVEVLEPQDLRCRWLEEARQLVEQFCNVKN